MNAHTSLLFVTVIFLIVAYIALGYFAIELNELDITPPKMPNYAAVVGILGLTMFVSLLVTIGLFGLAWILNQCVHFS